ncbi:MAG: hypothetical protein Q4Q53_00225 [Methanocorpusculum sp.]|nr:hypothetical protein [Methanocorpusculum sp.]
MKKLLQFTLLLAVICLIVAVAGCTGSDSGKATPTPTVVPSNAVPTSTGVMSNLANVANLAPGVYPGEDGSVLTVYADHSYDVKTKDGTLSYGADGKIKITASEGTSYVATDNEGKATNTDGSSVEWKKLDNGLYHYKIVSVDGEVEEYDLPMSPSDFVK